MRERSSKNGWWWTFVDGAIGKKKKRRIEMWLRGVGKTIMVEKDREW